MDLHEFQSEARLWGVIRPFRPKRQATNTMCLAIP
jgi:hypothetical protein